MDNSLPGISPLNAALEKLGAAPARKPASFKDTVDGLARQTMVPANILLALDEAGGGKADAQTAQRNASALAEAIKGGAKLEDAVGGFIGDPARTKALMDRSYAIADELYPLPER